MTDMVVHSEERLVELLGAMAACDGSPRLAARRLQDDGQEVSEGELQVLRERHAGMYQAIAIERSNAQEQALAQEYRELARLGQRATRTYLEDLNAKLDAPGDLPYDIQKQLPQIIQALAKVQQVSVDKLLSLTGRPTDGGSGDPLEAAKKLMALGVLVPRERPEADVDTTATEVTA